MGSAVRAFDLTRRVFVLGVGMNGLGAVRSLGKLGIPVVGIDWESNAPGFRSRLCESIRCAHPVRDPVAVLELLLQEGKRLERSTVMLPTTDHFVLFMSRHREALAERFLFALPDPQIVESILNKRLQYELAERIGIPFPQTFYPRNLDELAAIRNLVEYPALLKPYYSHEWQAIFDNKGFQVDSPSELEERFSAILPHRQPAMVQSLVLGPSSNYYKAYAYIDAENRPLAIFTARRLRQFPIDFGTTSSEKSEWHDDVARLGVELFRRVNYRGPGEVEMKRDDRDGQFKLIELNPRLWGQNSLATYCGVNFPLITYLDLTGQGPRPRARFREGITWLDAVNDFQAFWIHFRRGELSPGQWARELLQVRAFAYFDWRDPLPFLAAIDYGLKFARLPRYLLRYPRGRAALERWDPTPASRPS